MSIGDMPPDDAKLPKRSDRDKVVNWITTELKKIGKGPDAIAQQDPSHGNRLNHQDLFSGKFAND